MSAERQWPDEAAIEASDKLLRDWSRRGGHHPTSEALLAAAVAASPVVAPPPCPTCGGSGDQVQYALAADGAAEDIHRDCPACNGSGVERMVPLSEIERLRTALRELAEAARRSERRHRTLDTALDRARDALNDLSVFLDSLHAEPGTDHCG